MITNETTVETVNIALLETFNKVATDNIGCIVYVCEHMQEGNSGGSTGFNRNCGSISDGMVAILQIADMVGVDLQVLVRAMQRGIKHTQDSINSEYTDTQSTTSLSQTTTRDNISLYDIWETRQ